MNVVSVSLIVMLMVDEVIVCMGFGVVVYKLVNFSNMINIVVSGGFGGMDMGIVLVNGYVVIYVIYNLMIGVLVFLVMNVMSMKVFEVYSGVNMLVGMKVSVFVFVWLMNLSG